MPGLPTRASAASPVEHVGGADEVGDEPVRRVLVDVAGAADLLDAARR